MRYSSSRSETGNSGRYHVLLLAILFCVGLTPSTTWAQACPDVDLDGYADCTVPGCDDTGLLCGDCDDDNVDANPAEVEACNHFDDDCSGLVDEGFAQPLTVRSVEDTLGGRPSDWFGASVAGIGDVTGDGAEDFVVGISQDDAAASNAGSVLLYSGADRSIVCRAVSPSPGNSDNLGNAVSAIPDMTGDGVGDFLAGAKFDDDAASNAGSVLLFSGADCAFVRIYLDPGAGSSDELGISVSWLEDITGDSIPEVVAGVWRDDDAVLGVDSGSVVVFNGANAAVEYKATDPMGATSDWLGGVVKNVGDIDGDTVDDIAAGASLDDDLGNASGSVLLFSGADGSFIRKLTAGSGSDNLGVSVAAIGDVDGDTVPDIAAGAPGEDVAASNHGAVVIFSGVDGSVLRTMTDPLFAEASISLGISLASMGDLTGDGIAEVLAGAYFSDVNGSNSGSAFIFDPTDGTQFRGDELVDPAGAANDQLGLAVGAADVTGDGMAEALVGTHLAESVEEADVGKVVIFSYESDCDTDGSSPFGDDCDDTDSDNYTGNTEICDLQDNDCDTVVDEDDDGDGFGVCDGDCDEANPLIYPGAPELCNGVDDDCNGVADNGADMDMDGAVAPCDCDDDNNTIFPGATEVCNHADENCGEVDEGFAQPLTAQSVQDTVDGRPGDWFGASVAGIGDVTGDGAEDFVVGISQDDAAASNAGSVLLYSGADRSIVCRAVSPSPGNSDNLGNAVSAIPDMTGDGVGDFLAGAKFDDDAASNAGSVLLFSGADCAFVRIYLDPGAGSSDELGISVSWLPDITGDSLPEVVAGAWFDDTSLGVDAGSVVVFNGATALPVYKLTDPDGRTSDWLGGSVTAVGDVDFDGVADIATGARRDSNLLGGQTGSVLLFSGADGSLIRKLTAGSASDNLGFSVLALDDVNGDGVRDVAAGAPGEDLAASNHGAVVIFSGVDGSVLRTMADPLFAEASISLGVSLASMGDLTGDGIAEVLAGAYFSDVNGSNSGSAFIFDPTDGTQFRGDELVDPAGSANDQLGLAVGAADVTGDGMAEALVGAHLAESVEEADVGKVVIFSYESDCDTDGSSPFGDDCDDTDSANYTGNTEICDVQDNDCDTAVDEDDDGDGFGVCDGDCDEANPLIYPGAPELCNGLDDDCDAAVDNGTDVDGDLEEAPCDCDDNDASVNTSATEVCNHADENCGEVDEGFAQPLTAQSVQDTVDGRPSDWFGAAVSGIGDVTGDGAEDFVVGISQDDAAASNGGSVLLYSGADRSIVCRAVSPSPGNSDNLGNAVSAIPDMTGDGVGDFLAGAKFDDDAASNGGSVLLFSGADCAFVRIYLDPGAGSSDELGISVSWLPDITGDSLPEVVAGAWFDDTSLGVDAGSVVVFNGATALPVYKLTDPDGRTSDWLGGSVTAVGDVDFDGVADIATGARRDSNLLGGQTGSVLLFSGADGSLIRKLTAGSASDNLGFSVLALDDVNGDGVRDVAAGAPGEDLAASNHGAVVIFSGVDGSVLRTMADPLFAEASISLGVSLASMGDLTGDGIAEVLAGAYFSDVNGSNSGSAFIFDPTDGTQFRGDELVDPAGSANDQLGLAVGAADVTGDGMAEALVGAHLAESVEEADVGKVVIFSYESDCDTDGSSPFGDDCDDTDSANYTGNTEICDVQDNDCDTVVDEDDDGDGFGVCDGDCDEANPLIYPGAPELCNGLDDDCDAAVDNGTDVDGDLEEAPCDCDDTDATVNTSGTETCDRRDEDCDGEIDEGFTGAPFAMKLTDSQGAGNDYFGYSVAGIGDGNGDGAVDFVVGVRLDDTAANDGGSVLLYSGHDRSELCRATNPVPANSDWLGTSVAGVGDINGDGRPDFAAGSPFDDDAATNAGSVMVFSGVDCSFIRLYLDPDAAASDELGISVAGLPDITGDSVPEILAGAWFDDTSLGVDAGSVVVFNGATGLPVYKLTDPDGRTSDWLGGSVTAVGDVDFDGVADIATGAQRDSNLLGGQTGSVLLFSGADGSLIRKMTTGSASDNLGFSLAALDDVDGDGVRDIAAGAPGEDVEASNAGAVIVFSGGDGSVIRLLTDPFGSSGDALGYSLDSIPDVSGDGISDVVAGAYLSDVNGSNSGSAFILDTATGAPVVGVAELIDSDGAANDWFGFAVASVGDIRNGGVAEVVIGAYPDDDATLGMDSGSITLFSFDQYDCDVDGSGPLDGDCGDTDPNVPGPEVCDGADNDCDGGVDEDFDADMDLFSTCTGDCDDTNPAVNPDGTEIPDNGVDEDCSGTDSITCYSDTDTDTFGDPLSSVVDADAICDAGFVDNPDDCDDTDPAINPNGTEIPGNGIDEDCDGSDGNFCYTDSDADGFGDPATGMVDPDGTCDPGTVNNPDDCDDTDDSINPNGTEIPDNGIDEDCSGTDSITCYADTDSDTFGDPLNSVIDSDASCNAGFVADSSDCDDTNGSINPNGTEIPDNGIDEDCNGTDSITCYADTDSDTFGDPASSVVDADASCDAGFVVDNTDCDDTNDSINPNGTEIPDNGIDEDCNGIDAISCYADTDSDMFGDPLNSVVDLDASCDAGFVTDNSDCDDTDGSINPNGMEIPDNGIDEDCSGTDSITCYADTDSDTFGDPSSSVVDADASCDAGFVANPDDCDDTDGSINPNAIEIPGNGIDENCDGSDGTVCYTDSDADGFGDPATGALDPDGVCDAGTVDNPDDCDDTNDAVNPNGTEVPDNGIDEDCSGSDSITCYADTDSDTFGDPLNSVIDADGTCDAGFVANDADCDDTDGAINPNATEVPGNGIDEDCDGFDGNVCYTDSDSDGFGDPATGVVDPDGMCDAGTVDNPDDCDDTDGSINPNGTEIPDNGIDEDCNGIDAITCYADTDSDAFGDPASSVVDVDAVCDAGFVADNTDCDDTDGSINPNGTEIPDNGIDEDCNGIDAITCYADADSDTFGDPLSSVVDLDATCDAGFVANSSDCDDTDGSINPNAAEIPENGIDEDCNGIDAITCYADTDSDSFGDPLSSVVDVDAVCDTGFVLDSSDCDDTDDSVNPNGTEVPDNGIDEDCSGTDSITCYADTDSDTFGDPSSSVVDADASCDAGFVANNADCDDTDGSINPNATEIPGNGIDEDCDGLDGNVCYTDSDADGFGDPATGVVDPDGVCDAGTVDNPDDCDDTDGSINPNGTEIPDNGIDEDCNGIDSITCYADTDSDTFGDPTSSVVDADAVCDAGFVTDNSDCDDIDDTVFPGATEVADDGIDQDCNGADTITCFDDADQDTFGDVSTTLAADGSCDTSDSESTNSSDCDDTDNTVFPGATEIPDDGIDQDCNGSDTVTCFVDTDQDTYGSMSTTPAADGSCDIADSESSVSGDCDDADAAINPVATEVCDAVDNNCNGTIDEGFDTDSDGFTICAGDCDDADPAINPGVQEVCDDTIDNDCDMLIDLADILDCGLTVTNCSTLGDQSASQEVDEDVWSFTGTSAEDVTITLESNSNNTGRANLIVVDAMGDAVQTFLIDRGALPNALTLTLPADGEYRIGVSGQARLLLLPGNPFSGSYCLTVDASQGAAQTLTTTSSVEGSGSTLAGELFVDATENKPQPRLNRAPRRERESTPTPSRGRGRSR